MSDKYTLVAHTGLPRAVETRGITDRQAEQIRAAGGLTFSDYSSASKAEESENYPPDVSGLYPRVRGRFTQIRGFDEAIYIPLVVVEEAPATRMVTMAVKD